MLLKVSYSPPSEEVVVAFNYAPDYVARIKKIPGARYRPESKLWQVPLENFEMLEGLFKGEIVYDTPRRVITGEPEVDYHRDIVPVESIPTAVPLYGFQKFGASFLARRARGKGFAFLCDATGIGKSPQSLGARLLLMQALGVDSLPTLVVAPAAVRHQWVADVIPKFLGDGAQAVEVEGDQSRRLKLYGAAEITVVNYEALMRDADLLPKKLKFGLVVLDECQKVKNRLGRTHRALKKLLKRMPGAFRFLLTATPVMNDLDELYALFDLACPGFFGKYGEFRERYMRIDYSRGYPKLIGYRRLDELSAKIGPYILRRTPSHPEVASSLPELVAQNLYVEPDREQKRLHDILYDEWCRAMDERAAAGEDIERLEALCRGYITLMQGAADDPRLFLMSGSGMVKRYAALCSKAGGPSPKLKLLADLAGDLAPQGKMLVFSRFERMVQLAAQVLEKYRPAVFTGKNKNFRDSELERFRNDPACRVMLATDAGGVGLDLQVARYVVNLDLPWSPGQLEQRYGRMKRFGSGHDKVLAVNLVARGTIDERILAALERKEDITKTVICER